jgi:hypothetical protein
VDDCRTKDSPLFINAEESLLVIRGLGIQTSTSSATYLSKAATRFIPTTQIQDIVIHEAYKGFEVRFYLAVIVEGEPDVVVVFPVCPSYQQFRLMLTEMERNSYRGAQFWKRFGGVLGAVYMTPNHEIFELDRIGQDHSMMRRSICLWKVFSSPPFLVIPMRRLRSLLNFSLL